MDFPCVTNSGDTFFSATDAFPDETPYQQRHQPAGDSHFSDIEDGGSDDDSASHFLGDEGTGLALLR